MENLRKDGDAGIDANTHMCYFHGGIENPPSRLLFKSANQKTSTESISILGPLTSQQWCRIVGLQSKSISQPLPLRLKVSNSRIGAAQIDTTLLQSNREVSIRCYTLIERSGSDKTTRKPKPMGTTSWGPRNNWESPPTSRQVTRSHNGLSEKLDQ